jgi:hypothetical protein
MAGSGKTFPHSPNGWLAVMSIERRGREFPGKPDALGASRTPVVDPTKHIRLGMNGDCPFRKSNPRMAMMQP